LNTIVTTLRIATRSSPLALWQANHVAALLRDAAGVETELVHVSTLGDRDRSESLATFGGIGVFTREVQRAVLDGRADLAVHSLKDLPTDPVEGLTLAAVPARAPRFDALVLPGGVKLPDDPAVALAALPDHARLGTGSPRRRSQLLRLRPDLRIEDVRGNVETRLRKLDDGEYDALVLAEAGLSRLEFAGRISARLTPPALFPAVGQAALGIECRLDDPETLRFLAAIDEPTARAETTAERAALAALRAGCHAPVGTYAEIAGDRLRLDVVVLSHDGRERFAESIEGATADAADLGCGAAEALLRSGAARLLTRP
jgi:hydroxymethylbilane synthase